MEEKQPIFIQIAIDQAKINTLLPNVNQKVVFASLSDQQNAISLMINQQFKFIYESKFQPDGTLMLYFSGDEGKLKSEFKRMGLDFKSAEVTETYV